MRQSQRIEEHKLKGELGLCHPNGRIEIDPKQKPKEFLTTLVHELLHREMGFLDEPFVERSAIAIAEALWKMGYRRIYE